MRQLFSHRTEEVKKSPTLFRNSSAMASCLTIFQRLCLQPSANTTSSNFSPQLITSTRKDSATEILSLKTSWSTLILTLRSPTLDLLATPLVKMVLDWPQTTVAPRPTWHQKSERESPTRVKFPTSSPSESFSSLYTRVIHPSNAPPKTTITTNTFIKIAPTTSGRNTRSTTSLASSHQSSRSSSGSCSNINLTCDLVLSTSLATIGWELVISPLVRKLWPRWRDAVTSSNLINELIRKIYETSLIF